MILDVDQNFTINKLLKLPQEEDLKDNLYNQLKEVLLHQEQSQLNHVNIEKKLDNILIILIEEIPMLVNQLLLPLPLKL